MAPVKRKPNKPDRFERMVHQVAEQNYAQGLGLILYEHHAVTLLRAQHRAMVRMVKVQQDTCNSPFTCCCEDIFDQLKKRKA